MDFMLWSFRVPQIFNSCFLQKRYRVYRSNTVSSSTVDLQLLVETSDTFFLDMLGLFSCFFLFCTGEPL